MTISKILQKYDTVSHQALEISSKLEQGQAETPLTHLIKSIQQDQSPFTVSMICLTPQARQSALQWLYGYDFAVFNIEHQSQIGLLELELKDKGYALQDSSGKRSEYESWEAMLQALKNHYELSKGDESLTVSAASNNAINHLKVLLPESLDYIAKSPGLVTQLLKESNILLLVGEPSYALNEAEKEQLNLLLNDMQVLWPLLPVDELASDVAIPERGWWTQIQQPVLTLAPKLLTTHVVASIPDYLTQSNNELRESLRFMLGANRFHNACSALMDQHSRQLKQLQSRKKREERKADTINTQGDYNSTDWSQLRTLVNDRVTDIQNDLATLKRRRESASASGNQIIKSHIESLNLDDLQEKAAHKQIQLSINQHYLDSLEQTLTSNFKTYIKEDLNFVDQELLKLQTIVAEKISAITSYQPQLKLQLPSVNELWQELDEAINIEIRYQGEMPKRGIMARLGEGRKSAFALLMGVTMLSYMGINLRSSGLLGLLIPPVAIGAILYSFYSWRQEDKYRLDKELNKVKQELSSVTGRQKSELNRLSQQLLSNHIDKTKKQWLSTLEQQLNDYQARSKQENSELKEKAKNKVKVVSKQISDYEKLTLPLERVLSDSEALISETQTALSAMVN